MSRGTGGGRSQKSQKIGVVIYGWLLRNCFIGPPFYWKKDNVTCRDWKMKYCCENLWGMPGNYSLVASVAEGSVPKAVSEKTDVLVDPPLKKHLFEDCTWHQFVG